MLRAAQHYLAQLIRHWIESYSRSRIWYCFSWLKRVEIISLMLRIILQNCGFRLKVLQMCSNLNGLRCQATIGYDCRCVLRGHALSSEGRSIYTSKVWEGLWNMDSNVPAGSEHIILILYNPSDRWLMNNPLGGSIDLLANNKIHITLTWLHNRFECAVTYVYTP